MDSTTGIDLAADPKRTALARIAWEQGMATLTTLKVDVPDHYALHYLHEPEAKVAIDSPLGWPVDFLAFTAAHAEGRLATAGLDLGSPMDSEWALSSDSGWRRPLANRATDMHVRQMVKLVPLSVSTDRIAHVAMRAARLMAHCSRDMRRDGAGDIAEVYPAASLRMWGMPHRGYKGAARTRDRELMVEHILQRMPRLQVSDGKRRVLVDSDDALDAFICALTARAVVLGGTDWPQDRFSEERAMSEGWIHVPTVGLEQLIR